jgi:hypothetical protein
MKLDKVKFGLQSSIVILTLTLASLFLQISSDVALFDEYGINPNVDTNRFFGYAIILCFTGLLLSIYTYVQYRKTITVK